MAGRIGKRYDRRRVRGRSGDGRRGGGVDVRVGIGHDTHRLVEGRPLILGGVRIDHPRGLIGHSDADVVLHAVADALLGAAGLGDIGEHYPDTDPQWRGLDSGRLLGRGRRPGRRGRLAAGQLRRDDPRPGAEARPAQAGDPRATSPACSALDPTAVNVKAKTGEHVGPIGRGEAIACEAVVLLEPAESTEPAERPTRPSRPSETEADAHAAPSL